MEFESQILSAEYTIQNFENLKPEATPFRESITAYWSGFYHEANRLPNPNIDEEAKGFLKMSKKSNLIGKLYLENPKMVSILALATMASPKKVQRGFMEGVRLIQS